jgi:hypothetical protein
MPEGLLSAIHRGLRKDRGQQRIQNRDARQTNTTDIAQLA